MEVILKKINVPLSGKDISKIMNGRVKIILYPDIVNYYSIDELLDPYGCVVILYMYNKIINGFYGHWCCIFRINDTDIEFFDPLGIFVDDELNANIDVHFRKKNGLEYPLLSYLLFYTGNNYNLTYNHIKFQKKNTSTCGRHCVVRLLNRDLDLDEYEEYIYSYGIDPDVLVTILTNI